jgi:hypothetical protein
MKLMPDDSQKPTATVWQGQGEYAVWNPAECLPYKYKTPASFLHKRECKTIAKSWLENSPLFLDTATTSTDNYGEVIKISIVDLAGNVIFQSF